MRSPHSPEPHQFQNIILQSPLPVGWSEMCGIFLCGATLHIIQPNVLLNLSLFCSPLADRAGWWGAVLISHCCFTLHALWYLDLGNWERFLLVRKLWLSVYLIGLVSSLHSVPVRIERRKTTLFTDTLHCFASPMDYFWLWMSLEFFHTVSTSYEQFITANAITVVIH